jgi:hypothetical protein
MMDYTTQIESFILGELDGAEREAFIEAMRHDAALAEEVERHRELMARLDGMRLRKHIRRHKVGLRPVHRPTLKMWIGMAAALTMLVVSMIWVFRNASQDTVVDQQDAHTIQDTNAETEERDVQDLAMEKYIDEARDKAKTPRLISPTAQVKAVYLAELGRLEIHDHRFMGLDEPDIDLTVNFQAAIVAMRSYRTDEALRILHEIRRMSPDWYNEDLDWMEALCRLLMDPEQGVQTIQVIAGDPTHEYRIRAMQVLEKLQQ